MDTNVLILEVIKAIITGLSAAAGTFFMIKSQRKKSDDIITTADNNEGSIQSKIKTGGGDFAGRDLTK